MVLLVAVDVSVSKAIVIVPPLTGVNSNSANGFQSALENSVPVFGSIMDETKKPSAVFSSSCEVMMSPLSTGSLRSGGSKTFVTILKTRCTLLTAFPCVLISNCSVRSLSFVNAAACPFCGERIKTVPSAMDACDLVSCVSFLRVCWRAMAPIAPVATKRIAKPVSKRGSDRFRRFC